jgi:hypothetical protein
MNKIRRPVQKLYRTEDLIIKNKITAILASILFLHCKLFSDILYAMCNVGTLHMCTKFEQNRTSGSTVMSDLGFHYNQDGRRLGGHLVFTVYVIS